MEILPCPIWPLAEHARFGQNCFDASIGTARVFCIHTECQGPSDFSSGSSFSPFNLAVPHHDKQHKDHYELDDPSQGSVGIIHRVPGKIKIHAPKTQKEHNKYQTKLHSTPFESAVIR